MLPIIRDLVTPRQTQSWEGLVRERLSPSTYGVEWCLTDIMRTPDRALRMRLIDVLKGVDQRSTYRPEHRYPGKIRLRKIGEHPILVTSCIGEPRVVTFDAHGRPVHQPHPQQLEHRPLVLPDGEWDADISSEVLDHDAFFLLYRAGWMAKEWGKPRRRWTQRGLMEFRDGVDVQTGRVACDMWTILEVAFETMHPELAPGADKKTKKRDA